jgi:hypothetical protein
MLTATKQAAAEAEPPPTARAVDSAPNGCPMDCCSQRHLPSVIVLPTLTFLPMLAVSDGDIYAAAVKFTRPGFSSHTDRGPPTA